MNNLIEVLLSLSALEMVEDRHWAAGSESGETHLKNIPVNVNFGESLTDGCSEVGVYHNYLS